MRSGPLLAVILLLLSAPLLAAADHQFTHRYVVTGRVLDAEGEPVNGIPVKVTLSGAQISGPCSDLPQEPRTGPEGDYKACFHAHFYSDGARVEVEAGEARETVALDPVLRLSAVSLRLPSEASTKDPGALQFFAQRYRVEGRLFEHGPSRKVEGIPSNGTTAPGAPVTVTLLYNGGLNRTTQVTSDSYGDFVAQLELEKPLESGTLLVRALGLERSAVADAVLRRSDVSIEKGEPGFAGAVEADAPAGESTSRRETPVPPWAGALALAAAASVVRGACRERRRD